MDRFIQDEKEVLREFNDLSILFKKDGTYEINARYRFESLISAPMSPVYDDNIGCIVLKHTVLIVTGKQEVYAGGWTVNGELLHSY